MGTSATSHLYDAAIGGKGIRIRGLATNSIALYHGAVVRWDQSIQEWTPAIASGIQSAEALGVVDQQFPCDAQPGVFYYDVVLGGEIEVIRPQATEQVPIDLVPGEVYFLSNAVRGGITRVAPNAISSVVKAILVAKTTTIGVVTNYIGYTFDADCKVNTETIVPVGTIKPYARILKTMSSDELAGWLLCDGSFYSPSDFPELFEVIGYSFGRRNDKFAVPNMDGKTLFGVDRLTETIGPYTASSLTEGTEVASGTVFADDFDHKQQHGRVRFLIRSSATAPADIEGSCCDAEYEQKIVNHLVNGNFAVWQRGTEFLSCCTRYTADRWVYETSHGTGSVMVGGVRKAEFNPRSTASVENTGSNTYAEFQGFDETPGPNTSSYFNLHQKIPGVATLAGKTATLSFWAKGSHGTDENNTIYVGLKQDFGTNVSKCTPISLPSDIQFDLTIPPSFSASPVPSQPESPSPEPSQPESPSPEPSQPESPSPEPSQPESPSPEPSLSATPPTSVTATATATPSVSVTATVTATPPASVTATATATPSVSVTATVTATPPASATATVTATPSVSPSPTILPSLSPTPFPCLGCGVHTIPMDSPQWQVGCVAFVENSTTATCTSAVLGECYQQYGVEIETYANSPCTLAEYAFDTGTSEPAYSQLVPIQLERYWKKYEVTINVPDVEGKVVGNNHDDYLGVYFWTQIARSEFECVGGLSDGGIAEGIDEVHSIIVATNGADTNSGTLTSPLRTVGAAATKAKQYYANGGLLDVEIQIRGGTYQILGTQQNPVLYLDETFTPPPGRTITFKPYGTPAEQVTVIGSEAIPSQGFSRITNTDPLWSRLPETAKSNVYVAVLPNYDLGPDLPTAWNGGGHGAEAGKVGMIPFLPDLIFNGESMTLARWPNKINRDSDGYKWQECTSIAEVIDVGTSGTYCISSENLTAGYLSRSDLVCQSGWGPHGEPNNACCPTGSSCPECGPPIGETPIQSDCICGRQTAYPLPDRCFKNGRFRYPDSDHERMVLWKTSGAVDQGIWLHGFWRFDWSDEVYKIVDIDIVAKIITVESKQPQSGIMEVASCDGIEIGGDPDFCKTWNANASPRRWFAFNLPEELDQPGEYYVSKRPQGGVFVYFWPPTPLESSPTVRITHRALHGPTATNKNSTETGYNPSGAPSTTCTEQPDPNRPGGPGWYSINPPCFPYPGWGGENALPNGTGYNGTRGRTHSRDVFNTNTLLNSFFKFHKTQRINVEGLTFSDSSGSGIELILCKNTTIKQCKVFNARVDGICARGGSNVTIDSCTVHDIGRHAIVNNGGNRQTLQPANKLVTRCSIKRWGRNKRSYACGVVLNGHGNTVSYNLFAYGHTGITTTGSMMRIHHNRFHRVKTEEEDGGVIYSGRNFSFFGHEIENNVFTNCTNDLPGGRYISNRLIDGVYRSRCAEGMGHGTSIIYFDDFQCDSLVKNNVFYKCATSPACCIIANGGVRHTVQNNVFIDSVRPYGSSTSSRGVWNLSLQSQVFGVLNTGNYPWYEDGAPVNVPNPAVIGYSPYTLLWIVDNGALWYNDGGPWKGVQGVVDISTPVYREAAPYMIDLFKWTGQSGDTQRSLSLYPTNDPKWNPALFKNLAVNNLVVDPSMRLTPEGIPEGFPQIRFVGVNGTGGDVPFWQGFGGGPLPVNWTRDWFQGLETFRREGEEAVITGLFTETEKEEFDFEITNEKLAVVRQSIPEFEPVLLDGIPSLDYVPTPYGVTPSPSPCPCPCPSASASHTPTATPPITVTPTISLTNSISITPSTSNTPGVSATQTPSISVTQSVSVTPSVSVSRTFSVSVTPTVTDSRTPTATPPITVTPTISLTNSLSITPSTSNTPGVSATQTPTQTPSASVTQSVSVTPSVSVSRTPSVSVTPTASVTPSISVSPSVSVTPTPTPTPSPSLLPQSIVCWGGKNNFTYKGVVSITGIQLEEGETAHPYSYEEPYTTLEKCQWFYETGIITLTSVTSNANVSPSAFKLVQMKRTKRNIPDVSLSTLQTEGSVQNIAPNAVNRRKFAVEMGTASGGVAKAKVKWIADSELPLHTNEKVWRNGEFYDSTVVCAKETACRTAERCRIVQDPVNDWNRSIQPCQP